ncbi:cytochrome P450 4V2-like [Centruroides vittatus]|uniref:cytochrome P450 4V2-like n=1 Tax=Centruroides vittatus TaxID=120091 RepID=UPI00350FA3E1
MRLAVIIPDSQPYSLSFNFPFISIILLIVILFLFTYFNDYRFYKLLSLVPGPKSHPILGNIGSVTYHNTNCPHVLLFQLLTGFTKVFEKERVFRFWVCFRPIVALYKPEMVEALLSGVRTMDKAYEYRFLQPWLGTGLLTSTGNKWRKRRKLLTPSFHFRILEDFLFIFDKQSKILIDILKQSDRKLVDIVPLVTMCTLDIICETILGVSINAQCDTESEYVRSVHNIGEMFLARVMRPWLWSDFIFYRSNFGKEFKKSLDILHEFSMQVIRSKKQRLLREVNEFDSKPKRQAFLDLLLNHHLQDSNFTEEDIREEVDTFVFEGHDTTAMCLSWTLYLIGLHQEVQLKLQEEQQIIFGNDINRQVTLDDLKEMKYLECVIKESQRLYPSVPFLGREINEDTNIDKYLLPKGTTCFVFSYMLHRDPEIFPDPEIFQPERFLPENCLNRHPYAYVPFSAGPRNCIGQKFAMMELKTVISTVLRNFHLKSLEERDKILLIAEMVLRPKNGLFITIKGR